MKSGTDEGGTVLRVELGWVRHCYHHDRWSAQLLPPPLASRMAHL
jgi:hypothetical protein